MVELVFTRIYRVCHMGSILRVLLARLGGFGWRAADVAHGTDDQGLFRGEPGKRGIHGFGVLYQRDRKQAASGCPAGSVE